MKAVGLDQRKKRRQTASGYARGTETRQRIIDIAMQLFAQVGYERTSLREIASQASVKAPAFHYYFEGKRELYFCCPEHIHLRARQLWEDVVAHTRQSLEARPSRPN